MLLHKSHINLAIPVILDLFSSLYDLPVQICKISTRVALTISVKNLFFANISKSKPQMMYVASQVVYKLGHSGHLNLFSSLYDLPVQICKISTRVALTISVKNLFFANISKSKPQMIYVASQVTYKLGHCGHCRPVFMSQ